MDAARPTPVIYISGCADWQADRNPQQPEAAACSSQTHQDYLNSQDNNKAANPHESMQTDLPLDATPKQRVEPLDADAQQVLKPLIPQDDALRTDEQLCTTNVQVASLTGPLLLADPTAASGSLREQIISFFQATDNKLALKLFGNQKAVMRERLRQRQTRSFVIHPCSNFRYVPLFLVLYLTLSFVSETFLLNEEAQVSIFHFSVANKSDS